MKQYSKEELENMTVAEANRLVGDPKRPNFLLLGIIALGVVILLSKFC